MNQMFLRAAALVLLIIAAVLAFLTDTDVETILGLISVGLAVWVGSTLVP